MIMIEGFPNWDITGIDQSVAACNLREGKPSSRDGIRISAHAKGARYENWRRSFEDDAADNTIIYAVAYGETFDEAYSNLLLELRIIERTNRVGV